MKTQYDVNSDRYGWTHKFVQIDGNKYKFVPAKDWMPIYVTSNKDGGIEFVDTDGGPCIGPGWSNGKITVEAIEGEYFILKEIEI